MKFSEKLNSYLEELKITPKELSKMSNLSPTLISRYLNGKRTPSLNSEYLQKLIDTLYTISSSSNNRYSREDIYISFERCLKYEKIDYETFINNFNILLNELKINLSELAKYTSYDTSFISKIKNGERKPSNMNEFANKLSEFIVSKYNENSIKKHIAAVISCDFNILEDNHYYKSSIYNWLITSNNKQNSLIKNFLETLDTFNLNDYTNGNFENIKVITSPVVLKTSKTYLGKDGRKKAESDFLKTTLLSKSKEPIFFYSNLPILDVSKDESFKEKWITAITMLLKKGNHLNIIHDISRPLNEMLLGLESWIPIYMTGSISPYYFKDLKNSEIKKCIAVSGSCAMSGEYINNSKENIMYYVTSKNNEIKFYSEKAHYLLSIAKPLMTIFKENDEEEFQIFLRENSDYKKISSNTFKNIDFYIKKNKWVIINKNLGSKIHFVIFNDKLRTAIEQFLNI